VGYKGTDEWKEESLPSGRAAGGAAATSWCCRRCPTGRRCTWRRTRIRVAVADWLTAPGILVTRAIVNRIWFCCGAQARPRAGRHGPNAPWSPELLAYLEQELVAHQYDLKHVYRLILNSNTYQLDSRTNRWNAADEAGFSHYRIRQLDAEPLLDAINQVLGSGEKYTSDRAPRSATTSAIALTDSA
jgi:hypothetical protein